MIYYFLPNPGCYGGVKVGCQFVELLIALGRRAVLAIPGGIAPSWFRCAVPVVDAAEAERSLRASDAVIVNWPADYERLKGSRARLVNHCQGTSETMYPMFADSAVEILTCWRQATDFVRNRFGRAPVEVGIFVSDEFFFRGERKRDNLVAYMPRRGYPLVRACMRTCGEADFTAIDGFSEAETGHALRGAGIYLATAVDEMFGLPALEAMAAGCFVVSVPVVGGMDYLRDGENCIMAVPGELAGALRRILAPECAARRAAMRHHALLTASRYRRANQVRRVRELINAGLLGGLS